MIEVLYEDEDLLAVNKPHGMVVQPSYTDRRPSVIETLREERSEPVLTLVHRLDRETSGVLLLARNKVAARECGIAMQRRAHEKTYLARVRGTVNAEDGTIDQPIGRSIQSQVYVRKAVLSYGDPACTTYRTVKREKETTVLELHPQTGRTHQLRVHCEWLGHPIVGDPIYGHPDEHYLFYCKLGPQDGERMELHAWKLTVQLGKKTVEIESPLPTFFCSTTLPAWRSLAES